LIRPDTDQLVDPAGNIVLRDRTVERLQLVADVLAKGSSPVTTPLRPCGDPRLREAGNSP